MARRKRNEGREIKVGGGEEGGACTRRDKRVQEANACLCGNECTRIAGVYYLHSCYLYDGVLFPRQHADSLYTYTCMEQNQHSLEMMTTA